MPDFYADLGVSRSASADEIKAAFRAQARKLHPDVNKAPDAAATFAKVQRAYEVLGDTDERAKYDRFGHEAYVSGAAGMSGAQAGRQGSWPGQQHSRGASSQGVPFDWDDDDIHSMFDSIFGQGASRGQGAQRSSSAGRKGPQPRARTTAPEPQAQDVPVDLLIAATGGTQRVTVSDASQTGTQTIDLPIPRGTRDGEVLRVAGVFKNSPTPDVLVRVRIKPHEIFRIEAAGTGGSGLDVVFDLPLTIAEATLGASVEVPTSTGGRVSLTVPAGSSSGRRLRMRGLGLLSEGRSKGDLVAVVQVQSPDPEALSEHERQALIEISRRGTPPRAGRHWR